MKIFYTPMLAVPVDKKACESRNSSDSQIFLLVLLGNVTVVSQSEGLDGS